MSVNVLVGKEKLLFLNGIPVEIKDDPSVHFPAGSWLRTVIYIYDSLNNITKKEIHSIIEYLYNEGFIMDRRTSFKIIKENGADNSTTK